MTTQKFVCLPTRRSKSLGIGVVGVARKALRQGGMLVGVALDLNHLVAVRGADTDVLVGRKGVDGRAKDKANGTGQTQQQRVGGGIAQPSLSD